MKWNRVTVREFPFPNEVKNEILEGEERVHFVTKHIYTNMDIPENPKDNHWIFMPQYLKTLRKTVLRIETDLLASQVLDPYSIYEVWGTAYRVKQTTLKTGKVNYIIKLKYKS